MAFMDLTKKELIEAADYYSVDIDPSDNKQEIADALEASGVTFDQWEADHAPEEEVTREAPEVTESPAVESEEAPEPADDEPVAEDMVLVRFIGRNRSYQVGKWAFSPQKPFALMTKPEYDSLDRFKFREATKSEAAEFYS